MPIEVPTDAGFGQRGIDDALRTEVLLQALGDAEDASELADALTDEDDLRVSPPWPCAFRR